MEIVTIVTLVTAIGSSLALIFDKIIFRLNKSQWKKIRTRLCCGLISLDVNKKTMRSNPMSQEDDMDSARSSDEVDSERLHSNHIEMTKQSGYTKHYSPFSKITASLKQGRQHGGISKENSLSTNHDSRGPSKHSSYMNTPTHSFIHREHNANQIDSNEILMQFKEQNHNYDASNDRELSERIPEHSTPPRYVRNSSPMSTSSFTRTNLQIHQNQYAPIMKTLSNTSSHSHSSKGDHMRKTVMLQSIHQHQNSPLSQNRSPFREPSFYQQSNENVDVTHRFASPSRRTHRRSRGKTSFEFHTYGSGNLTHQPKHVESMDDNILFRKDPRRMSKDDDYLCIQKNTRHIMLPFEDGDIPVNINEKLKKEYQQRRNHRTQYTFASSSLGTRANNSCDNITTSDESFSNQGDDTDATTLSPNGFYNPPTFSSQERKSIDSICERL